MNTDDVRDTVRSGYGAIAQDKSTGCCGTGCCSSKESAMVTSALGYSTDELAGIPTQADMGLSCGNPTAIAELREGEVVLDLGSGGGLDVFIAGPRVGASGRVIGVDMTPEMISRARRSIADYRERTGLDNVEFRLGEIEHLPLENASVDVVISNCVLNLSPEKPQVWREIARVLKPGGRVAISDLALLQPLPREIAEKVEALLGCIAGAVSVNEIERMAREAGLGDIEITTNDNYVQSMTEWQDLLYREIVGHLPEGQSPADFITSALVKAKKR